MPSLGADLAARMALDEACWFPGLAARLADHFWAETPDLDRALYSTARWLDRKATAPAPLMVSGTFALEPLPGTFGTRFVPAALAPGGAIAIGDAIGDALRCLAPGAADVAVRHLVRTVHAIEARGPGYDCSHSEPSVPFSVFVSVPLGERQAALRLAESLLHEAMHLQLTLIERQLPLIDSDRATGFSPWQQCERPLQGLLHGLYVFTAIDQWLACLASDPGIDAEDQAYIARRRSEIASEIAEVRALADASTLTAAGRTFAAWLLAWFSRNAPYADVPAIARLQPAAATGR